MVLLALLFSFKCCVFWFGFSTWFCFVGLGDCVVGCWLIVCLFVTLFGGVVWECGFACACDVVWVDCGFLDLI